MALAEHKPSGCACNRSADGAPVRMARAQSVFECLRVFGGMSLEELRDNLPSFTRSEIDHALDDLVSDDRAFLESDSAGVWAGAQWDAANELSEAS